MGIVLNDIAYAIEMAMSGLPSKTAIGRAGVLDTTVISGMIAVGLAEIIGETREKLQSSSNESDIKDDIGNEKENISHGKEVTTFEGRKERF